MSFIEALTIPGEHPLLLAGLAGQIEAILTVPEVRKEAVMAFIGHPHSLQGGSMNNKVVTTLARTFKELGISSLRFNFRGVGQSAGSYDAGIGESDDMLALVQAWQKVQPDSQVVFAGFSFGSYVAYRAAAQIESKLLISIAPPVHHYDYQEFSPQPTPWIILQGDADEVVPYSEVKEFALQASPLIPMIEFADTGHFFHGKLLELKQKLLDYLKSQVSL